MKPADRLLQRWRIGKAMEWVPAGSRVLDVGCADGSLFRLGKARITSGVGVDPRPLTWDEGSRYERRIGTYPAAIHDGESFDAVVMLAVVEHIDADELERWAKATHDVVRPGGRVIMTIPSPLVDQILHVGQRLGLLEGMEVHQHHGFEPGDVVPVFIAAGFELVHRGRFQLGLNNLFVFRR
jgi:SAM-dependent methyltransferase